MTSIFLYCFFVGFGLTLISVLLGFLDFGGGDLDGGLGGDAGGSLGGDLAGSLAGSLGGDVSGDLAHGQGGHRLGSITTISPVNFQTIVAALMGFGGFGYLVSAYSHVLALTLLGSLAGAVLSAWLVFKFQRFLARGERPMGPTSYAGITGRLTVPIREGGTGEVVYVQHGSRMVSAARSVDGRAIAKGEEVVILRYEKGIAYVQPWREFMNPQTK